MPIRIPTHLTDSQLISELTRCARDERVASAVMVAHLAEMEARGLHRGAGFPSLFAYCREVLRLSEGATCKRIDVARAARRFPVVLERLVDGSLSLSAAGLLARNLTGENHRELIAAAAGLGKRAVAELLARRFPKPDVAPLVRKLPTPAAPPMAPVAPASPTGEPAVAPAPPVRVPSPPPPLATPLSADRYQIRFTASTATWEKLRVARDLLRHAVPSGDPGEIFDRALTALIAEHAKKKIAAVAKPVRRGRATAPGSRHVPAKVRRAVWARDRGQCAFVAASGRRCAERGRLEFHHVHPYAAGGEATVANIQLRCRAHNAYEAEVFYGRNGPPASVGVVSERPAAYGLSGRGSTAPGSGRGAPREGSTDQHAPKMI